MQRYFLHWHNGKAVIDTDGTLLSNDDEARAEAIRHVPEMLRSFAKHGFWSGTAVSLQVVDQTGRDVATIHCQGSAP